MVTNLWCPSEGADAGSAPPAVVSQSPSFQLLMIALLKSCSGHSSLGVGGGGEGPTVKTSAVLVTEVLLSVGYFLEDFKSPGLEQEALSYLVWGRADF